MRDGLLDVKCITQTVVKTTKGKYGLFKNFCGTKSRDFWWEPGFKPYKTQLQKEWTHMGKPNPCPL
jgi:hypothetical protein